MAIKERISKYGAHIVVAALTAIMCVYGCGLLAETSCVVEPLKFHFREAAIIWPWGMIQLLVFTVFWFLTFQVSARSRVFALCILMPILLEFVFHSYLNGRYAGVAYATVVESAFCATLKQARTYVSARLIVIWALVIACILAYTILLYARVWRGRPTRALRWVVAWGCFVLGSYLGISCHGTSIPNARFYLAQYTLNGSANSCYGEGFSEAFACYSERRNNPIYCEISERQEASNVYLPYSPFITWVKTIHRTLFFNKVCNAAEYNSSMHSIDDKLCVVLYIGESFRHDHTPFSGYRRNTLPKVTEHHGENIIAFPNVISYHTYTIPCMYGILSDATNEKREASTASFMSIFRKHGFHCIVADGSADGAPWSNAPQLKPILEGSYDELFCYNDEKALMEIVARNLNVYRFNMMLIEDGSGHWPYEEASCKIWGEDNVAKYDETRLISDGRLNALMEVLKGQPAIILFVSDHGESLGEGGRICHGGSLEAMEQRFSAAFVWYSDAYAQAYPEVVQNLKENAESMTEQGYIFHTMPTLGRIRSAAQNPEMDIAMPQNGKK